MRPKYLSHSRGSRTWEIRESVAAWVVGLRFLDVCSDFALRVYRPEGRSTTESDDASEFLSNEEIAGLAAAGTLHERSVHFGFEGQIWFHLLFEPTIRGGVHFHLAVDSFLFSKGTGVESDDPRVVPWVTRLAESLSRFVNPDQGCLSFNRQVSLTEQVNWGCRNVWPSIFRVNEEYYTTMLRERHGFGYWLGPELRGLLSGLPETEGAWYGGSPEDSEFVGITVNAVGSWSKEADLFITTYSPDEFDSTFRTD